VKEVPLKTVFKVKAAYLIADAIDTAIWIAVILFLARLLP
jgi:hypothetical protein